MMQGAKDHRGAGGRTGVVGDNKASLGPGMMKAYRGGLSVGLGITATWSHGTLEQKRAQGSREAALWNPLLLLRVSLLSVSYSGWVAG